MKNPDVKELCKYSRDIGRALNVLKTKQIWCSKPVHFNDPFDGNIPFEVDYSPAAFVSAAVTTYSKDGHKWEGIKKILDGHISADGNLNTSTRDDIEKTAKEFFDKNQDLGILSLAEKPDSVLMWSHYADSHKGVCICFDRTETNDLGDDDACSPVRYSDVYPTLAFSQLLTADGSLTQSLLYTKARDWSYEKEWRLMIETGNTLAPCPAPISRAVLGCRATPDTEAQFLGECRSQSIPLYRAKQVPGAFMLDLEKVFTP